MKEGIFWPVLLAVIIGMSVGPSLLEDNRTVIYFCFAQSECSVWHGSQLVRRTFVPAKDGTHVLVQTSDFTFIKRNKRLEFSDDNSEELLSACEIYDAKNWTCHKATGPDVGWNIMLRDGKLTNVGFFVTGPSIWRLEFYLYRWFGYAFLPRAS